MLPVKDWKLVNMIDVSRDLGLLHQTSADFADRVRHYRNFVHPGTGLQSTFSATDALRLAEVIGEVMSDLETRHIPPGAP